MVEGSSTDWKGNFWLMGEEAFSSELILEMNLCENPWLQDVLLRAENISTQPPHAK